MPLCRWCRAELEGEIDTSPSSGLPETETCSRCGADPSEEEKPMRIPGVPA